MAVRLECVGEGLKQVVGILSNMVPFRRRTNLDTERERINIDDADMFMGETQSGALFSMQSSYVTAEIMPVGALPAIAADLRAPEIPPMCRVSHWMISTARLETRFSTCSKRSNRTCFSTIKRCTAIRRHQWCRLRVCRYLPQNR